MGGELKVYAGTLGIEAWHLHCSYTSERHLVDGGLKYYRQLLRLRPAAPAPASQQASRAPAPLRHSRPFRLNYKMSSYTCNQPCDRDGDKGEGQVDKDDNDGVLDVSFDKSEDTGDCEKLDGESQ